MDYSHLPNVERLLQSYPRRSNLDQAIIEKLQVDLMTALNAQEFEVLEDALIKIFKSGNPDQGETAVEIMADILAYTPHSLDSLILAAIETQGFVPAPLFRGAGDTVKRKLFTYMKEDDNLARRGLAWIGDEEAVNWFAERKTKRQSKSQSPSIEDLYPQDAGWELTPDNEKRLLFSLKCYEMVPLHWNQLSPEFKQEVSPELCKLCNSHVVRVKDVKTTYFQDLFSLSLQFATVDFPFCELCSGLAEPMRSIVSANGTAELCKSTLKPKDIPDWFSDERGEGGFISLEIGPHRDPFFMADYCRRDRCSQIGGHPTWVQDSEYPSCQSCGRTMLFFMQIDGNQLHYIYPFMFYYFVCDLCPEQIAVSNQHT